MARITLLLSFFFAVTSLKTIHTRDVAAQHKQQKDDTIDLCNIAEFTTETKVQCFCKSLFLKNSTIPYRADCMITAKNIPMDDEVWKAFVGINTLEDVMFSSKADNIITYVPTAALDMLNELLIVTIKFGRIYNVHSNAFSNLKYVRKIKLPGNEIQYLSENAFANHPNLTSITLDNNRLSEIKRNVFTNLPILQELFLTRNNISFIEDRAFLHLKSLKNLELENNSIFVLTNETFLGLVNLTQLDLRDNNLEVIGDNTFAVLKSLQSLILQNNEIAVLDDNAFHGLNKLESLSLANNKLTELKNARVFAGLPLLSVLDLKANGIKSLSADLLAPIIQNFFNDGSNIGFEDNKFPCDCELNWFITLKNRTKNSRLQQTIENLMCYPNDTLRGEIKKYEESEKVKEYAESTNTEKDYEYYDETNLDGRIFFIDIPSHLVPCEKESVGHEYTNTVVPTSEIPAATTSTTAKYTNRYVGYKDTPTDVSDTTAMEHISSPQQPTYPEATTRPTHYTRKIESPYLISHNPAYSSKPETTLIHTQYTPIARTQHPTEDIVKDAFETTTKIPTSTNDADISNTIGIAASDAAASQSSAEVSNVSTPLSSMDIIKETDNSLINSGVGKHNDLGTGPTVPESASRVDVSKSGALSHSMMLVFAIPAYIILTDIRLF